MITIAVKTLREVMGALMPVVEARNTIPILSTVLLSSGPSTVTFTVSDMDIIMQRQADLAEPGKGRAMALCVDARALNDIARKLPADAIATLEPKDGKLLLKAGRSRFNLPTLAADDFPIMATGDWDAQFEIPSTDLVALIDSVRFAMSIEETRYYLNGVYIHHVAGWNWRAVATDGHRLMVAELSFPDAEPCVDMTGQGGVIIPRKGLNVARALLDKASGVTMALGEALRVNADVDLAPERPTHRNRWQFTGRSGDHQMRISGKVIDGTYPDYARVIPKDQRASMIVDLKALRRALNAVSWRATARCLRAISLTFADGEVRVGMASAEGLAATMRVACKHDCKPGFRIVFNGQYLLTALNSLRGDEALFGFGSEHGPDSASPVTIRDPADTSFLNVIMPMRV